MFKEDKKRLEFHFLYSCLASNKWLDQSDRYPTIVFFFCLVSLQGKAFKNISAVLTCLHLHVFSPSYPSEAPDHRNDHLINIIVGVAVGSLVSMGLVFLVTYMVTKRCIKKKMQKKTSQESDPCPESGEVQRSNRGYFTMQCSSVNKYFRCWTCEVQTNWVFPLISAFSLPSLNFILTNDFADLDYYYKMSINIEMMVWHPAV